MGVDAYKFLIKPNYEHGKQVLTDAAHLASITYGFAYTPMLLTAADVGNKIYQREYSGALKSVATSFAYQAIPVAATTIAGPVGGLTYSALMTGYSGGNLLENISKLYQENAQVGETEPFFSIFSSFSKSKALEKNSLKNKLNRIDSLHQCIIKGDLYHFPN